MISFLITSKNEPFLQKTIESIRENAVCDIEVLAEKDDGRGQRSMLNRLARKASGEILCKVDAHCSFGYGFDEILLQDLRHNVVIAPTLLVLDGETWTTSHHNKMHNYAFDTKLVMHHVPSKEGVVVETMCMQGSFFMCYKDFYFKANLCDERLGSWGSQGCELGIQTWYNKGECLTSKKTYYGHVFRHTEKDFPYKRNQKEIDNTYNAFINKYKDVDLGWLVKKFECPLDWNICQSSTK